MTRSRQLKFDSSTLYTVAGEVGVDTECEGCLLDAGVIINGSGIVLEGSLAKGSHFVSAPSIQVRKSRLETIDAANAIFDQSGWSGSEVVGSRFTGAQMNGCRLNQTVFTECRMNLMQCQESKLRDIRFEKCDLRGAYFNMSAMSGTVFAGSDLTGADFSGAEIRGCDFRRAIIEDIRVSPDQMHGVIVTADQALYLARLFGLDVRE